jgi:protein CpxP
MKKSLFLLAALAFATAGTSFAQTAPVKTTGTNANQTARHYQKGPKDPAKMATTKPAKWPRSSA